MSILIELGRSLFVLCKRICMLLAGIVLIFLLIPFVLMLLGYRINGSATDIAKEAAKKNNVQVCSKIFNYGILPLGPTSGESRRTCIHTYASLTKDPSACELLMPSSYGLSCVGASEIHLPCDVTSVPYSVYWRDGAREQTEHIKSCLLPNPQRSELGNQCCTVAKVAFLKKENDCSGVKDNTPIYDHCLYSLAWKQRDPTYCLGIENENARSACEVQTKAMQNNPTICRDCQTPIEKIEDLQ